MGAASGRRASRGVHVRAEGAARASAERGVSPGAHQNDVHHAVLTCGLSVGVRCIEIVFFVFEWSWGARMAYPYGFKMWGMCGVPVMQYGNLCIYGQWWCQTRLVLPLVVGGARASAVNSGREVHTALLPEGPHVRGGPRRPAPHPDRALHVRDSTESRDSTLESRPPGAPGRLDPSDTLLPSNPHPSRCFTTKRCGL